MPWFATWIPSFEASRRGVDSAPRTPGRERACQPRREWLPALRPGIGAGHFVKMVHNGVEYGLMAAYAEGLNILKNADIGLRASKKEARRRPRLRDPQRLMNT